MKVTGIECPWCLEKVWSRHHYDCRPCKCGYCYVDGGRDYTRFGYGGENWPEPWAPPLVIKIEVPDEPERRLSIQKGEKS